MRWLVILLCACGNSQPATPAPSKPAAPASSDATPTADASRGPLGPAIKVAVAQQHVCAILASGQVACWGDVRGMMEPPATRPVVVPGINDAIAISPHDCVLRSKGPAMCWEQKLASFEVPGTEGARDLAEGRHGAMCFVLANGSVACEEDKRLVPVNGLTNIRAVDDWSYNTWCLVRDDGQLECPDEPDLGKAPKYADAIDVIRYNQDTVCAVRKGGALSCWGGPHGQAKNIPARIDQIFDRGCRRTGGDITCFTWTGSDWSWTPRDVGGAATDLSCDGYTCCAIVGGAITCWGDNSNGRLGDGVAPNQRVPTKLDKLPEIATLVAGERFTMAIAKDGALYAWGLIGDGPRLPQQIGYGKRSLLALAGVWAVTAHERDVTVIVPDDKRWRVQSLPQLPANARAITRTDSRNVCAALVDGTTRCLDAEKGWITIKNMTDMAQLSAVGDSVCGATSRGRVACLIDTREDEDAPPPTSAMIVPGITNARSVTIPLVELADGTVVEIKLDEKKKWHVTPKPALTGITQLSTGGYAWSPTCGIKDRRVHCWSEFGSRGDTTGILGRGTQTGDAAIPAPIAGSIEPVAVAAGNSHACALDGAGAVWCWGNDSQGELGLGRNIIRPEPGRVVGIGP